VAAVDVASAVVLDVAGHLVCSAAHPPWRVGARALAPARAAEPLRLVVEEAPVRPAGRGGEQPGGGGAIVVFIRGGGAACDANVGRCGGHWSVRRSGSHRCHGRGNWEGKDEIRLVR
jgi:hypothetical protein